MSKMPKQLREECAQDPRYSVCAFSGQIIGGELHECGGRVTWEHALKYAGSQIQEKWAIVPICEKAHAVNTYQDAGTMDKERNVWVALSYANEDDFKKFPKAWALFAHTKERLNKMFGIYIPKFHVSDSIFY